MLVVRKLQTDKASKPEPFDFFFFLLQSSVRINFIYITETTRTFILSNVLR